MGEKKNEIYINNEQESGEIKAENELKGPFLAVK